MTSATFAIDPAGFLKDLFRAAVSTAQPGLCIPANLPAPPAGQTVVIGAGKAAAAMARAVEESWQGPLSGLVVTRYGHNVPCQRIEVVEAAHPVPDEAGERASARILELAASLGPDDLLLCLISGGGSALLALPAPGLTIADKQAVNRALLRSGAAIDEMNCVRKHLSAIKGGRLAVRCRAPVVTLAISDVPGDDLSVIASGPTVADPTSFADAIAILNRYRIDAPDRVWEHLKAGADETPKPGDPRLANTNAILIATPQQALEQAASLAWQSGITPLILSDAIEGEARDAAGFHAAIARQVLRHNQPVHRPCVLLSGGETTVTVRGNGRGGRNAEFLLALAVALDGAEGVYALAADTDGIDGTEDNAGAIISPLTLSMARQQGLNAAACLNDNDGYSFFQKLNALIVTGPTLTNVNDFRAILIV